MQALHQREQIAAPDRIESLLAVVDNQKAREGLLQLRYKALLDTKQELKRAVATTIKPATV